MTSKGRNKTLCLSKTQIESYVKQALTLKKHVSAEQVENKIIMQDTLRALDFLPDSFVDLMVVDPPYNLTKQFSGKAFKEMDSLSYQNWLDMWLSKVGRILKDNASIYICSDWKTSIDIPQIAGKYFILQNRISWEREKGRGAQKNWKNCLEDIWFYTKSSNYTFNLDAVKVMRPVIAPYKDETGKAKDWKINKKGQKFRLTAPSNIWTDISVPFWSMAENTPHPTQKPEKLIAKLILASSREQDLVFDPFLGSGTTAVTAFKLNRRFLGIEQEPEYVAYALKRLEDAKTDKHIQGFEDGVFKWRNSNVC